MEKNYEIKVTQAPIHTPWKTRPTYELQEGASVDELRATAIRAMKDELTVPWTPNKDFIYHKTSACAKKYSFFSNTAYAGLPYTTGGSGFLQWYDMIDPETGILYDADFENLGYDFGNSCASSVSWGTSAVCASAQRATSSYDFVPMNGWLPLGEVEVPEDLKTYRDLGTDEIIEKCGVEKVLAGYMLGKPGDAVVATADPALGKRTANHCMMYIQEPVIVRNEDGTLNLQESKLIVQDQWSTNYDLPADMQTLLTRGHTYKERSFENLLKDKYIAMSTAEYLGLRPYEKAKVWCEGGESVETLDCAKLYSNYRPAVIILKVEDASKNTIFEKRIRTSGSVAVDAYDHGFSVKELLTEGCKEALKKPETKAVILSEILTTGEEITAKTVEMKTRNACL